ncbi:AMP-binding protein [Rhodococcus oxybenzonivorans]|uniref:AMP-binding protein n=1 Tax=Rhodococcus TaxID=1827 RepID=UPI00131FC5B6|nr:MULTISPECIES: AMP-binding protein [Rhodococcus]MDV7354336.1 AMP-binding protein [Rhodococcus oxybenzonivorans]QHE67651.1 Long-chain-fatty-acid--CoA ligase [Rhodococcus sp. WAY2]
MSTEHISYTELADMPARQMSMGLALSWHAARDPHHPALTMNGITLSRLELDRAANRLARDLAQRGVGRDDRVAVVLPTGPKHQITCHSLWKLGATVVPLPARVVESELGQLVSAAHPALIIGAELDEYNCLTADFEPDSDLPDGPLPEVVSTQWKASTSGGSTGSPKLIVEDRTSLIHPEQPIPILHMRGTDVLLHPAGAYHNAAFSQTNWALCWGIHVMLMERFDAREWLRIVQDYKVCWAYLVPTMMSRILSLPADVRENADVSTLRIVIHMAAPCPPWVKQAWIDWIGPEAIWEIYAGTEGYGATMISGPEWLEHRGSVGKAPPGTEIRNDEGRVLGAGEIGTVWFSPPVGNPFGHSLEYHTYGDVGSIDENGYLYLADRRTDLILTGGVNVYPAEIESVLEQAPGVVTAAVIGLPDPDLGAVAHAILELEPGLPTPTSSDLTTFVRTRLSPGKVPFTYEVVSESLRDEAGKLRRSRLRDERLATDRHTYLKLLPGTC